LLAGGLLTGGFYITLDSSPAGSGACSYKTILGSVSTDCVIEDARRSYATACNGAPCFFNLAFTPTHSAGGAINGFTVSGSAAANQAGTIAQVSTGITVCGGTSSTPPYTPSGSVTPAVCFTDADSGPSGLTATTLASGISVALGQTVAVTVAITFSS
jgi:hypothetical protein